MAHLLSIPKEIADEATAHPLRFQEGSITLDHVSFAYERHQVLQNCTLTIQGGKTVAFVGESGAGKTSLFYLLLRFFQPLSGKILIDGQDLSKVTRASLRQIMGLVPQDTILFHDTLYQNIAYGRQGAQKHEVIDACKAACLHDFVMGLEKGYDTMVGERGLKLSGGQRQRVAIARAFLKKPKIFLFDEATSALDSVTEKKILQSFSLAAEGTTTLIIAHRLSTIVDVDQIYVMQDGQVVEQGRHHDLLRHQGHYAKLWGQQMASYEG